MFGVDCEICKRAGAALHVISEKDKDYDKAVCLECWAKISKKEKRQKKLRANVAMY